MWSNSVLFNVQCWFELFLFRSTVVGTCTAGQYGTTSACAVCDYATYQPSSGQGKCLSCPSGSNTTSTGSTALTSCSGQWIMILLKAMFMPTALWSLWLWWNRKIVFERNEYRFFFLEWLCAYVCVCMCERARSFEWDLDCIRFTKLNSISFSVRTGIFWLCWGVQSMSHWVLPERIRSADLHQMYWFLHHFCWSDVIVWLQLVS